jgi:hypothetical protein
MVTMLALVIPVVCSGMAIKQRRKTQDGFISFKEAFITGILIAAFAAVFTVPCQLIFHTVINPDFFDNMIAYSQERAAALKLNVMEAKLAAELYFNLSAYLIQGFLGTLFFGTIVSAIMAWRMKTEK